MHCKYRSETWLRWGIGNPSGRYFFLKQILEIGRYLQILEIGKGSLFILTNFPSLYSNITQKTSILVPEETMFQQTSSTSPFILKTLTFPLHLKSFLPALQPPHRYHSLYRHLIRAKHRRRWHTKPFYIIS